MINAGYGANYRLVCSIIGRFFVSMTQKNNLLQVQGMGTALKILFSGKFDNDAESGLETNLRPSNPQFRLKRAEIVALFNAFGR